jgi:flagellar biosynthesis protein FliQ
VEKVMDANAAIDVGRHALVLTLMVSAPLLATALVVGFVVSLFQAVTQIQDHTLSFVPKIACVLLVALLMGPWIAGRLVEFAREMLGTLP